MRSTNSGRGDLPHSLRSGASLLKPQGGTPAAPILNPNYNGVNPADHPPVALGPRTEDLAGRTLGRLEVVHHAGKDRGTSTSGGNALWLCRCQCGVFTLVKANNLKRGDAQSCGCLKATSAKCRTERGPESKDPRYEVWLVITRKHTLNHVRPDEYRPAFNRTDEVCPHWMDLEAFIKDIGPAPSPRHRYSRIDKRKAHGPGNWCWKEWAGKSRRQRSDSRFITYAGERLTVSEWSRKTGIHTATITNRLDRYGWTVERALTTKPLTRKEPRA